MSEAQNWGNRFAGPDKVKHFPWALLGNLFSPLKKQRLELKTSQTCTSFVLVASSLSVLC